MGLLVAFLPAASGPGDEEHEAYDEADTREDQKRQTDDAVFTPLVILLRSVCKGIPHRKAGVDTRGKTILAVAAERASRLQQHDEILREIMIVGADLQ